MCGALGEIWEREATVKSKKTNNGAKGRAIQKTREELKRSVECASMLTAGETIETRTVAGLCIGVMDHSGRQGRLIMSNRDGWARNRVVGKRAARCLKRLESALNLTMIYT